MITTSAQKLIKKSLILSLVDFAKQNPTIKLDKNTQTYFFERVSELLDKSAEHIYRWKVEKVSYYEHPLLIFLGNLFLKKRKKFSFNLFNYKIETTLTESLSNSKKIKFLFGYQGNTHRENKVFQFLNYTMFFNTETNNLQFFPEPDKTIALFNLAQIFKNEDLMNLEVNAKSVTDKEGKVSLTVTNKDEITNLLFTELEKVTQDFFDSQLKNLVAGDIGLMNQIAESLAPNHLVAKVFGYTLEEKKSDDYFLLIDKIDKMDTVSNEGQDISFPYKKSLKTISKDFYQMFINNPQKKQELINELIETGDIEFFNRGGLFKMFTRKFLQLFPNQLDWLVDFTVELQKELMKHNVSGLIENSFFFPITKSGNYEGEDLSTEVVLNDRHFGYSLYGDYNVCDKKKLEKLLRQRESDILPSITLEWFKKNFSSESFVVTQSSDKKIVTIVGNDIFTFLAMKDEVKATILKLLQGEDKKSLVFQFEPDTSEEGVDNYLALETFDYEHPHFSFEGSFSREKITELIQLGVKVEISSIGFNSLILQSKDLFVFTRLIEEYKDVDGVEFFIPNYTPNYLKELVKIEYNI